MKITPRGMTIDINSLKNVLVNRLKTYQENHIDSLLITYNIKDNTNVDKNYHEIIS